MRKEEANNGDVKSSHLKQPSHTHSWIYTNTHTHIHTPLEFIFTFSITHFTSRPNPKWLCRFVVEKEVLSCRTLACFEAVIAFLSWSGQATLTICIFNSSKDKKERSPATFSLKAKQTELYRNRSLNGSCWHLISRFTKLNLACPIDNPASSRTVRGKKSRISRFVWNVL